MQILIKMIHLNKPFFGSKQWKYCALSTLQSVSIRSFLCLLQQNLWHFAWSYSRHQGWSEPEMLNLHEELKVFTCFHSSGCHWPSSSLTGCRCGKWPIDSAKKCPVTWEGWSRKSEIVSCPVTWLMMTCPIISSQNWSLAENGWSYLSKMVPFHSKL